MTPAIDIARAFYNDDTNFNRIFQWHLRQGYIWVSPACMLLARPIERACLDRASDLEYQPVEPDTWFIWVAAGPGSTKRFMQLAPYVLPYVAWHRHGESLRLYQWDRLVRKIYGNNSKSPRAT
jgi:hypothetical protein